MLYLGAPDELEAHLEHNSVQQETYKSIGIQIINFLALQTRFLDLPTFFFACCPEYIHIATDLMKSSELPPWQQRRQSKRGIDLFRDPHPLVTTR